jgi:hypothetical protein
MQEQDRGRTVFRMVIQWEEGEADISVHENDEPQALAEDFRVKYGVDTGAAELIEGEIDKRIDSLIAGKEEEGEYSFRLMKNGTMRISELGSVNFEEIGEKQKKTSSAFKTSRKIEQFKKIFRFLSRGSQKLSTKNMQGIDLNHRVCRMLMPILIDIDCLELDLAFDGFCRKIEVMFRLLSKQDQEYLMGFELDMKFISRNSTRNNIFLSKYTDFDF